MLMPGDVVDSDLGTSAGVATARVDARRGNVGPLALGEIREPITLILDLSIADRVVRLTFVQRIRTVERLTRRRTRRRTRATARSA